MPKPFFSLPIREQAQILNTLSTQTGINRSAILLEKDIWVCWALEALFKMPSRLPMAFKGGTSLSKAFQVINRFSEDVDITLDCQAFGCGNPFSDNISNTQIRKISDKLKSAVTQHLKEIVIPYYKKIISEQFTQHAPTVAIDDDGETILLHYPSIIDIRDGYINDSIKLEFGGRNLAIPHSTCTIKCDIADYLSHEISLPLANVAVLSPEKTFWEKITLIHYECNRPTPKEDGDRISRHWYDTFMLMQHDIGKKAISNRALLQEVIKIKKIFYNSSFARYDDCMAGKICLVPNKEFLNLLSTDFDKMIDNKMFYGEEPKFDSIMEKIDTLQAELNNYHKAYSSD